MGMFDDILTEGNKPPDIATFSDLAVYQFLLDTGKKLTKSLYDGTTPNKDKAAIRCQLADIENDLNIMDAHGVVVSDD